MKDYSQQLAVSVNGSNGKNINIPAVSAAKLVSNVTGIVFFILAAVAVGAIIYGGILYMTSRGDKRRVQLGCSTVTYSVIGLIVVISAWAIVEFILNNIK